MDSAALFSPERTLSWIDSELTEQRIVGAGLEVYLQDRLVFTECFGSQNSMGVPVTNDTRFWIASMTKPVVSIAALKLIESGNFRLTDPVSAFISEFGNAGVLTDNESTASVNRPPTIHDLMTHTSGLTYGQFGTDYIHQRYAQVGVFDYTSDNETMAVRLCQLPLLYQPGGTFEYGMSTDLLGYLIEIVTGQPLDRILQDLVFAPLGMSNTSFNPDPDTLAELAPSVIRDTIAPDFQRNPTWISGGAGLFSTVSDYGLFARMLLGKGTHQGVEIVSQETFDLMKNPSLPADIKYGKYTDSLGISAPWGKNGLSFGLGLAVRTEVVDGIPGARGELSWPGVSGCNFWVDPLYNLAVIFLTHAPLHRTTHRQQLRDAIYAGIKTTQST